MSLTFRGPVYRHISEKRFADQFVTGESIWVSTFKRCREYEDAEQGDAHEGMMLHRINSASSLDPGFESIAKTWGIQNEGGVVTITDSHELHIVDDAYVVCFSFEVFGEDLKKKFGEHAVRVHDIEEFARRLEFAMRQVVPTVRYGLGLGPVTYSDRIYQDYEQPPGDIHFVKPVVPFKAQREYRIVILCEKGHEYKPFAITVPLPKGLCMSVDSQG
ncbi:hypothetical protein [Pseudomonas laurylsulfatiphila]|uniref:hypothetical protein n=1 Tax=Pseudomonas laurylsulfatiphila TaxID=2011015 RepID=UPI00215F8D45|nr:hypothetical protein [Pseudomonas laurylsulfatiphila]UVM07028.1 hypothetical protein LOY25_10115 [Pseudomonas laurylsulfatiphila]